MIVSILQGAACIAMMIAAILCHLKRSASNKSAYRVILPFIISAATLGIIFVGPYVVEFFAAYYGGAIYEREVMLFRLNGPYWWVYSAGFILPLLPIIGVFPAIGRRPFLITFIAFLAIIPACFTPIVTFVTRVAN